MKTLRRCSWCPPDDPLYLAYHDEEWGVPVRDGRHLFEMLNLEGAQAGLSWRTVLAKRPRYREVFEGFDPARLARWTPAKIEKALRDPGIIRNRLKVQAVVRNARAVRDRFDGDPAAFAAFLWDFTEGKPLQPQRADDVPPVARTEISDRMSQELRRQGFTFVGSTICHAFMQAVGLVNDHATGCFRHREVKRLAARG